MRKKHKNIYMGKDSTAKLPVFGRVDTDNEICLNAIATAYDALNNIMLTKRLGMFDKTTIAEINGRFSVLKMLCNKYAPNKLVVINKIHKVVIDNFHNKISDARALELMQEICRQHDINPGILNIAAMHVNQAEMQDPFRNMFLFFNQQNPKKRKMR